MTLIPDDTNEWLHRKFMDCPNCGTKLFCVDHSPMLDCYTLYCDNCANRVEVGYYDLTFTAIYEIIDSEGPVRILDLMQKIEALLRPCNCGGTFHYQSPRRCHVCLSIVSGDNPTADLYPAFYGIDADEITDDSPEMKLVNEFELMCIRRQNIWK